MKLISFIVSRHSFGTRAKCVPEREGRLYFCGVETGRKG